MDAADAVVYGLVAGVVLSRRAHPVAWLVALTAIGGGVAAVTAPPGELLMPDGGRVPPSWAVLQNVAWVPGTLALVLVVPYLVSAERPGRAARAAVRADGAGDGPGRRGGHRGRGGGAPDGPVALAGRRAVVRAAGRTG
ncbi:hypothetical protein [Streptomyces sp. NPDC088760]|uniref:hypothetical protein n=1 Tax=Streptomyces sp. NPDC088760 TaxID=3365890 RepID=UPI003802EEB5